MKMCPVKPMEYAGGEEVLAVSFGHLFDLTLQHLVGDISGFCMDKADIPAEESDLSSTLKTLIQDAFINLRRQVVEHINERSSQIADSSTDSLMAQAKALESAKARIQAESAVLQTWLQAEAANARKQRNILSSPIYCLPAEMLSAIMFQVLESRGDKDPDDVRSELSSVSHWWFDTVETTPMLWSFIRGEDDVDKAEYFIHRSKSASLAFEFHSKEATQQDVEDFINLALEYVPRWRSFRISCPSLYPMSWHFPRTAAPLLEEFTISSNGYGGMHIENLFDGNAPRLRVLSIIPHTIPWDSPILSGLSDTRIVDGEGERGDWGNRYHRLFSSSPMLEHVVIKQAGRPKSSPGPGALFNLEPVILSKLKSMELIDLPPRITTTVLSFLRRPVGYSSLIKANITSSDPDVVDLLLKSPPDALVPSMINHLTTLEIRGSKSTTFTRGYLRLHGRLSLTDLSVNESEYPGLYLDFSPPFTSRLFNFAMRFFTTSLVSLTIDGDIDIGEDTSDLARHLPLLQSLQELTLRRCKNQSVLHSIFTALQEPLPGNSEGHRSWPCPRLKKLLLIRLAFQIKKILELVETRYKLTPSSQGERPDPLQELDIRWDHSERTDKETIKKIEDIINEQNGLFSHTVGIPNY